MSDGLKSNLGVEKSNTACPLMCKCKWKRGKETVDCASKGFKTIPYIKDSGTQVCALNDFASNIVWLHHYQSRLFDFAFTPYSLFKKGVLFLYGNG